jgi:predicted nuclease with TOPRIM domain
MNTHIELAKKYRQLKEKYEESIKNQQEIVEHEENLNAFVYWLISKAHE